MSTPSGSNAKRTLALLDHPKIVTVYQVAESAGQPYIEMELLEGGCLADLLPRPPAEVARIGLQLCDALSYAHARGVVHRDLKPHNVLFARDGRAVLGDFGVARLRAHGADGWTLTADGTVTGTPEYMAPEARKGQDALSSDELSFMRAVAGIQRWPARCCSGRCTCRRRRG